MIKIIKASELEPAWFDGRNFSGTNEVVQNVINEASAKAALASKEELMSF